MIYCCFFSTVSSKVVRVGRFIFFRKAPYYIRVNSYTTPLLYANYCVKCQIPIWQVCPPIVSASEDFLAWCSIDDAYVLIISLFSCNLVVYITLVLREL